MTETNPFTFTFRSKVRCIDSRWDENLQLMWRRKMSVFMQPNKNTVLILSKGMPGVIHLGRYAKLHGRTKHDAVFMTRR